MRIINSSEELNSIRFSDEKAFIPTMGNLHEGHMSLVNFASKNYATVITSIFINPLQFGKNEDFSNYPRTLKKDIKLLEEFGSDYLFLPEKDFAENLQLIKPKYANVLCGRSRPNHFDGVLTIINKFLSIIKPDVCLFGLKDYQQQLIIKDFVKRLKINTEILSLPTVREASGLAMSSRNNYLSDEARLHCGKIYSTIKNIADCIESSSNIDNFDSFREDALKNLKKDNFVVDYLEIVDANNLTKPLTNSKKILIAIAVKYESVRLIDNIEIFL